MPTLVMNICAKFHSKPPLSTEILHHTKYLLTDTGHRTDGQKVDGQWTGGQWTDGRTDNPKT